ncbi:MAG: SPOR domain-containing protein [Cyclobacteriaceae bacterium]
METLAEQFQQVSKQKSRVQRENKMLKQGLIFSGGLILVLIGYLLFIEYFTPLFGRWPQVQRSLRRAEIQNSYLKGQIDSLYRVNDLLLELSPYYTGVFYEVQIGAFENFNLADYKDDLVKMNIDYNGPLDQYTLGKFRDLEKALAFQKDVQQMGIQDAFVVAKVDGERVTVKEAQREAERLRESREESIEKNPT